MAGNRSIDHTVGSRIALARIVRGWTSDQLARRAGIDPDMLRIIEAGHARAGARRLFDIARVLGMPVRWFFETAGRQTS
jgi:transcriptional regulator with XRE-family HTH domain